MNKVRTLAQQWFNKLYSKPNVALEVIANNPKDDRLLWKGVNEARAKIAESNAGDDQRMKEAMWQASQEIGASLAPLGFVNATIVLTDRQGNITNLNLDIVD